MRATLSICASPPGPEPDGTIRYQILRQLAAAAPTYGNDFLVFGQPGWPPPSGALLVLHNGTADWSWGDLLASHPALQAFILHCHWSEAGKPLIIGTKAAFVLRGGLATLVRDNVAPLLFAGDPP